MKKMIVILLGAILVTGILVGCGEYDDTIENYVIANEPFGDKEGIKAATQPENLSPDSTVYTSLHVIESPKGMDYTVKWYVNETEVKSETKPTQNDMRDTLVFKLEAEKVTSGTLKVEVLYKQIVLRKVEIPISE